MRILVCPHLMEIGGSQLNAVELAGRAAGAGHEVVLFGPDGDLVARVEELGLEYHRAPVEGAWPSRRNVAALTSLVRERRIDLVHGYEWGPVTDLGFGPHLLLGTPMVATVLSMDVPGFLPRHVPLVVGTRELEESARSRYPRVELMEPPIDTDLNAPGDTRRARSVFGVGDDDLLLSVVCRLTSDLDKAPGVLEAVAAVEALAARFPVRLLVAGDGPALPAVRAAADAVNRRTGRETVIVAGALLDPRAAYDAADVVLGMGSSALKGLAFAKPLVVQGTAGYWELLTPATAPIFLEQGWFGAGAGDGVVRLTAAFEPLLADAGERLRLGAFGRQLVTERFSLAGAAARTEQLYRRTVADRWPAAGRVRRLAGPAVEVAKFKAVTTSPAVRSLAERRRPAPAVAVAR
ncbi:glycosyltransferase [Blastococcus sp. TF02-9]|uniref:glycosyltransferase n=1 Tax=Blastococcus sp. TF02-09 TaxID=2250576 RepID=UPI0011BF9910|nr:glycosyltransferase [Blastococcus sp. TF02-9]